MENNIIKFVPIVILKNAVHDSYHATRNGMKSDLLSFCADDAWFSMICSIAEVEAEEKIKRLIRLNVDEKRHKPRPAPFV